MRKWPNSDSSSSPTGFSSETGVCALRLICSTSSTGRSRSAAISERRRLACELGAELSLRAADLVELLDDVDGHADRPALVGDRARHCLPDPPGRVGGELEPLAPVELLRRAHEPDRPLLDQVEERQPLVAVALRDRDDEAEVRLDHRLLRGVVAALDPLRELDLLGRREERHLADVLQEELQRVGRDLGLGRLPRALALGLDRLGLGDDDLDLLLVERVVERVDLRGVEVELVERERDLVRVEPTLRTTRLDERPPLVRREHDIRFRRRPFRVTRCSAQDRPFRRVARYGSHEVPTASTAPTGDQTPACASSSRYVWA